MRVRFDPEVVFNWMLAIVSLILFATMLLQISEAK